MTKRIAMVAASVLAPAVGTMPQIAFGSQSAPRLPSRACASALVVRVATDRRSYASGRHVVVTVTALNASGTTCVLATGSCIPQVIVEDSSGLVVWNRAANEVVCDVGGRRLAAHASTSRVITWDGKRCAGRDPRSCPGRPAPPGRYVLHASWGTARYTSTSFRIV